MTYTDVFNTIKSALTGRATGTKVQVEDHEAAEIALLNYIEQLKSQTSGSIVREAHAYATKGVSCNLTWSLVFPDSNYTYNVNGVDAKGNPVQIYLVSKSTTKLVVKTLVNATLNAIAMPYSGITA
ncbi:MAG: hypothetical protein WCK09_00400 [Bacteroidota bacterium]